MEQVWLAAALWLALALIRTAVVPTAIANAYFLPKHLLPASARAAKKKTAVASGPLEETA
jgi:hypothetical protein